MSDALTVDEVERLARRLRGELTSVPLAVHAPPGLRNAISTAQSTVDELLLLCELVRAVDDGLVVIVGE